jgi:hypothetical protein
LNLWSILKNRGFRIVAELKLTQLESGPDKFAAGGGLFIGNGWEPEHPDFSRSVWYVGNERGERYGERGIYLRHLVNGQPPEDILTITHGDFNHFTLDIGFNADGRTGTVGFIGHPDESRKPFSLPKSVLRVTPEGPKVASAAHSSMNTRNEVLNYSLFLQN